MSLEKLVIKINYLNSIWANSWIGVKDVFESCLERLGSVDSTAKDAERNFTLLNAGLSVANFIEYSGRKMARDNREPNYHSRLHTAVAIECLTALIVEQRRIDQNNSKTIATNELLALVAMTAHDAGHNGTRNTTICQLESRSFDLVEPLLQDAQCDAHDIYSIKRIIWSTDPALYSGLHRGAAASAFNLNYPVWQAVICQEADILASALPQFEEELTRELASEWRKLDPVSAEGLLSARGRKYFLTHFAKFSTPASSSLGLQKIVKQQLASL
ncbi:MAG: hypothetical protein HOD27_04610 [Betaproteobacteria bacterium]|nr:hypothetical protein [Betaproteobacteria bacterium]